ncbi:MAG: 4-demethylwyosine synthase TYW1 [Candidatus Woesearchaeota archaeon]|nr:4-demethylwyosine synthase TYW1 [Candidatus Woesearchaeota archaeon]
MEKDYKKLLEKQQYRLIGNHSAVKICTWTKKSLLDKGVCYKQKFYGMDSHRCCQISVSVNYCDQDCLFCWRERHIEPFAGIESVDEPKEIISNAIRYQRELLSGMGGNKEKINLKKLKESKEPKHFAISLTGETLYYPKLSELIRELKKQGYTSFVVTNGQLPEIMEKMESPTQLYLTVGAPNKEVYKKVCRPLNKDYWERLNKSLEVLKKMKQGKDSKRKTRTAIRLTLVKGLNMIEPENYAKLIEKAEPDFLEVKGYMFVGASRQKLEKQNMPFHKDIVEFAKQIEKHSSYKIIDEQPESRVMLMMKKDTKDRILKM